MTIKKGSTMAKRLQEFYAANVHARAFLDHLAQRGKNPKNWLTSVEAARDVVWNVDSNVTWAQAREVLQGLADRGCGDFRIGRRGWPTRIDWKVSAIDTGKAARGEVDEVAERAPGEEPLAANMQEVEFPLRDDLRLSFQLPKDLTEKEADRIAKFLMALPR